PSPYTRRPRRGPPARSGRRGPPAAARGWPPGPRPSRSADGSPCRGSGPRPSGRRGCRAGRPVGPRGRPPDNTARPPPPPPPRRAPRSAVQREPDRGGDRGRVAPPSRRARPGPHGVGPAAALVKQVERRAVALEPLRNERVVGVRPAGLAGLPDRLLPLLGRL